MSRFIVAAVLALAALVAPATAQVNTGGTQFFANWSMQGSTSLAVTDTSDNVALPTVGPTAMVCNRGADDAYLTFGASAAVEATEATGTLLQAGNCAAYNLKPINSQWTHLAAITATGATTLHIETGYGHPQVGQASDAASSAQIVVNTTPLDFLNVSLVPTVDAGAYAAGDALGGLQTVAFGSSGQLQSVFASSASGLTVPLWFYIWEAEPTATTCTNNAPFVASETDRPALIAAPFSLVPVSPGAFDTRSFAANTFLISDFESAPLYVCIVAGAAVTPASTTGYKINLQGIVKP
jgi:hypothetical protein